MNLTLTDERVGETLRELLRRLVGMKGTSELLLEWDQWKKAHPDVTARGSKVL